MRWDNNDDDEDDNDNPDNGDDDEDGESANAMGNIKANYRLKSRIFLRMSSNWRKAALTQII